MKKKVVFFAKDLNIGGIERAVLNYVKYIDKSKYDVSLFLEEATGIYIDEVPENVEIINYNICKSKNVLWRKLVNFFKLIYFSLKYYKKFDFAASFATYLKCGNVLASKFSSNCALWVHGDFWSTKDEAEEFLKYVSADKYPKIVFVSEKLKNNYLKVRPDTKQELFVLNNLINYEEIINKSKIDLDLRKNKLTLLNVGRHEEKPKQIMMLLNVCKRLLEEGYDFELWMVGDGPDHDSYLEKVKELNITKNVKFFGVQSNVFPYYNLCDAVVLSSVTEGNPVVFLEAKVLNKPVVSTDVSDSVKELNGYGIVVPFGEDSFYDGLKKFLDEGFEIKKKFNPKRYNEDKINKLYDIMGK